MQKLMLILVKQLLETVGQLSYFNIWSHCSETHAKTKKLIFTEHLQLRSGDERTV